MHIEDADSDRRFCWSHGYRPSERREQVLEIVRDGVSPLSLSALAAALVDREASRRATVNEDDIDPCDVQRQLHHVDLPKLQERTEIEYDPSRRLVL